MIKEIVGEYKHRGSKKSYKINMQNEIARSLYGIDSVNLILGNNGSGKTTIIKDFILALSKINSLTSVNINRDSNKFGVIYFTPSPFHKRISHRAKANFKFLDISGHGANLWQESPEQVLKDIEGVFLAFGIESSLIGESVFDLVDIAFDIFYGIAKRAKEGWDFEDDDINPAELRYVKTLKNFFSRYEKIEDGYLKCRRDVQQIESELIASNRNADDETLKMGRKNLSQYGSLLRRAELRIKNLIQRWINEEFKSWVPRELYLREKIMHIPSLLRVAIDKKIPERKIFHQFCHADAMLPEVDEVERCIYQWSKNDLLEITYDGGLLKLRFDLLGKSGGADKNKQRQLLLHDDTFENCAKLGLVNFGFENLSSGESAILKQCLSLLRAGRTLSEKVKDLLFIIDEGDMLLHLTWQRAYIEKICKVLASFADGRCVQLIVATHSPLLASDVVSSAITCLNDQEEKIQGFGAPMSSIFNYDFDAPPVGCIAEAQITRLAELEGRYTDTDRKIISIIDDVMIKEYLEDLDLNNIG